MRKALIGLILTATAMTPVAAWAQVEDGARGERLRERVEQRQQARTERREQRVEQRQQRVEQRQQRVEQRQQRVEQRQPRGDVQRNDVARERSRGAWGEQRRAERSHGAWGDAQRNQQAVQQQVARERRGDRVRSSDGQRNSAYPSAWQGDPNDPRRERYERLERQNQYRHGTRDQRQDVRREWRERGLNEERRREVRRDRRESRRDWRREWNRDGWRHNSRYDWRNWRYRNRSLFRLSPYYSPYRSHRYSRFSIGIFLEPLFYSQRYWIGDPWQYRLPYAPPGTQWVRYYNDVLLVDTWSGEVIDVIYDFFW